MSITFNADEIFEMAEEIERNAAGFYRQAAKYTLNEKTKRRALTILEDASTMQITAGKDPMGLAAAALYISCIKCKENVSQKEIALAAGVTEVTIRNRYKGLRESLKL